MIQTSQMPEFLRTLVQKELAIFDQGTAVTQRNEIPETSEIPIENPRLWLKIPEVVCVFVDMKNSTGLSASAHASTTAATYRLFTSTAIAFFHEVDAPYIDVKGDGVFALFNSNQVNTALAAAISFKTFVIEDFIERVRTKTSVEVGIHIGIDVKTVLVRKLGLKFTEGRTDRQNEVWAGKPVNMAAKLAGLSQKNEIIVSDRFYKKLKDEHVLRSCGCPDGEKEDLWTYLDLEEEGVEDKFDFEYAYVLKSKWCEKHGREFCEAVLGLD